QIHVKNFNLGTKTYNLPHMFGDIKFVCVGGSANRMKSFSQFNHQELALPGNMETVKIVNLTPLSLQHGMGIPSISTMLHELIKLLHHARCIDFVLFSIGTSGGVGLEPGTVVVTDKAVDCFFRAQFEQVLGKVITRSTELDVGEAYVIVWYISNGITVEVGKLFISAFNSFITFPVGQKFTYTQLEFGSIAFKLFNLAAVVCVTLLNRFDGDQISTPHDVLVEYQQRPQVLVAHFIKKRLGLIV
uniref:Uridine phosphorylase 2 n=1 Tax=Hucho hucho TaxID=62062 RepID=A0A4W5QS36_9TELE